LSAPNLTALLLRDSGYGVIEASSGIAALGALDANPAIEVLIVDFSMPGMSGIELLERARAKRPEIRAVFITGYVDHTWLNGKLADEIVVKKPFTIDQLAPPCARRWAIRRLVARRLRIRNGASSLQNAFCLP
jgi:CheY-like chemotaxis protein